MYNAKNDRNKEFSHAAIHHRIIAQLCVTLSLHIAIGLRMIELLSCGVLLRELHVSIVFRIVHPYIHCSFGKMIFVLVLYRPVCSHNNITSGKMNEYGCRDAPCE